MDEARHTLAYAGSAYTERGQLAESAGAIATAGCQTAHAVLAARGSWVTNEKTLLDRAGLRELDRVVGELTSDPGVLTAAVDEAARLFEGAVGG